MQLNAGMYKQMSLILTDIHLIVVDIGMLRQLMGPYNQCFSFP